MTEQVSAEGPSFSRLVLFDPPLFLPTSESVFEEVAEGSSSNPQAVQPVQVTRGLRGVLGYSPNLSRMVPGAHQLMAATTLRRSDDGEHYVLRCPPEYEARVLEYARSYGSLVDLGDLGCPTKVIGADPTLPFAYLPTFDLDLMGATEYDFLPDATHYLQLEKPEECVAALREYLDRAREARRCPDKGTPWQTPRAERYPARSATAWASLRNVSTPARCPGGIVIPNSGPKSLTKATTSIDETSDSPKGTSQSGSRLRSRFSRASSKMRSSIDAMCSGSFCCCTTNSCDEESVAHIDPLAM